MKTIAIKTNNNIFRKNYKSNFRFDLRFKLNPNFNKFSPEFFNQHNLNSLPASIYVT